MGRPGSRGREKLGTAGRPPGSDGKGPWTAGRARGGRGDAGREGGTCGREGERHRRGRRARRVLRSQPGAARRRQPTGRRRCPPKVSAQATRPRGRGADGPTDGAACRRRPDMFSRSSRKRLSSRSVSVPRPSGANPRVPRPSASAPAQTPSARRPRTCGPR